MKAGELRDRERRDYGILISERRKFRDTGSLGLIISVVYGNRESRSACYPRTRRDPGISEGKV